MTLTKSEAEIGWTFLEQRLWGGTYNREMKHHHARARGSVRRQGRVSRRQDELALAESDGEDRRRAVRHTHEHARQNPWCSSSRARLSKADRTSIMGALAHGLP